MKWKEENSIKDMGYGSPDGEEKDWGRATFEEIMMQKFPKLMKGINLQI